MSNLAALFTEHGQAVWLDYIQRSLLTGGGLQRLLDEDGVRGVTSNPSIFEKAIAGSDDYDEAVSSLLTERPGLTTSQLYEALAIEDIRMAADILRPVYDSSEGSDGFVSLEVSPYLANQTTETISEARRLWQAVDRANLMIKVPATPAGIPAIEKLIAEGINVNATLMFSLDDYEAVAQAYVRGLERCAAPQRVASVASFFVSRVDTQVDKQLESIGTPEATALCGKAAIANCKLTYRRFKEIFLADAGPFSALAAAGAKVQRPLWASTSTKNPAYRDVIYIEELIGPHTVNTIPTVTLDAFRDHGQCRASLEQELEEADRALAALEELDVDLAVITKRLQEDGVAAFAKAFDDLLAALDRKRIACLEAR